MKSIRIVTKIVYLIFVCAAVNNSIILAQENSTTRLLPNQFSENAYQHIKNLTEFGPRPTGSKNEIRAAKYIKGQFDKIGINSWIEKFEYNSFEFSSINFEIGKKQFDIVGLGFIPYQAKDVFKGTAVLIDFTDSSKIYTFEDISGKAVISNDYKSHFQLLRYNPSIIIYVDSYNFNQISLLPSKAYSLEINGKYSKIISPTVVAQLGNVSKNNNEILVGSHLDSYRDSPGASDNGSGIGVMLELAKYFKEKEKDLNGVIKFISFGAEEVGILGSRKYVEMHSKVLENCVLFYNIDDVGGNGIGAIETLGGVVDAPNKLDDELSLLLAQNPWEGVDSYWRILPTPYLMGFITTVNHPQWLVDITNSAVIEAKYKINFVDNLGADGMSFAHAGIPSTTIGITGDMPHTPFDNIDIINKNSLQKAGEISARVVLKTLIKFNMLESH